MHVEKVANKPTQTTSGSFVYKNHPQQHSATPKIIKVVGYLIDDLRTKDRNLPFPPAWLLNQLLLAHCRQFRANYWLKDTRVTVHHLIKQTEKAKKGEMTFIEKEGSRSLFPTYDAYTLEDFSEFLLGFAKFLKKLDEF
jgi:hypothetical protein